MKQLLVLAFFSVLFWGCEKIVAKDITAETPVLILPTVNDTVQLNPVHFKWEEMEGASKYHLQVVSPSFSAINQFVLDSVITGTDFYFTLDSNEYELQLTAQNGGYESKTLAPMKFWVGVASSAGSGNVVLTSPVDGHYDNVTFQNQFSWNAFTGATSYEFSIREGVDFATGTVINTATGLSTLSYIEPSALLEGTYFWGVKAYYPGGETNYTINTLYIDTIVPNDPIASLPLNNAIEFNGTISFSWNNGVDQGAVQSPITSTLEVSTDPAFGNIVNGGTVIGSTLDIDLTTIGTYYWRVINNDDAANQSNYSNVHTLTIQ
ncbi:MAG: hypothetical protein MK066_09020 [Crocinitomicaceae bacterium]|nr:hypothetical protein [Crocinitomicaceae bacterium]